MFSWFADFMFIMTLKIISCAFVASVIVTVPWHVVKSDGTSHKINCPVTVRHGSLNLAAEDLDFTAACFMKMC